MFLNALCLLSSSAAAPSTFPSPFFFWLDCVLIPIFTLEYLLQLCTVHDAECVDTEALVAEAGWDELETAADGGDKDEHMMAHKVPRWKIRARRTYRWATESLQICDILAILPFYLELLLNPPGSEEKVS